MRLAPKSAEDRRKFRTGGYGIPESAVKDSRSNEAGEVWSWERAGKLYALVFRGSAFKAEWYYSFRNEADRAKRIDEFFSSVKSWNEMQAKRKAERVSAPRGVKVGDILRSSWGYDQTNVDYYEVVGLVGKTKVLIREISSAAEDDGFMCGKCVPRPGVYIGEPMLKVARNGSVRIESYASASKIEPVIEKAGVKVFSPSYYSYYA